MTWAPPPPLADHARPASHPGTCALCHGPIHPGDRIARIADETWAHVSSCIAALPGSARASTVNATKRPDRGSRP